jgi:hypothetical protein
MPKQRSWERRRPIRQKSAQGEKSDRNRRIRKTSQWIKKLGADAALNYKSATFAQDLVDATAHLGLCGCVF